MSDLSHDSDTPQLPSTSRADSDSPPPAATTAAWLTRVRSVQTSCMAPALREQLLARAEVQRRRNHVSLQSMAIQQRCDEATFLTRSAAQDAPAQCSAGGGSMAAQPPAAQQRLVQRTVSYQAAWHDSAQLQAELARNRVEDQRARRQERPAGGRPLGLSAAEDDDADAAAGAHLDVFRAAPGAVPPAAVAADTTTLLDSLRAEPPTDDEQAHKFKTYETFSDAVSGLRAQLDQVAASAIDALPAGDAPRAIRHDLQKLDSQENTGVFDESRHWFVYDMARQTIANCQKIKTLSEGIGAKVRFAAQNAQEDCPICLDPFTAVGGAVSPKMLSCCHMVCEACWANWVAVQRGNAFCPLCKHVEFAQFIVGE
jgi:hypothetical protein